MGNNSISNFMNPSDSQLLSELRECRNVASKSNLDISTLNRKIEDVTKLVSYTVKQKLYGNIESLIEFLFLKTDITWITWNLEAYKNNVSVPILNLVKTWTPCSAVMALISTLDQLTMGSRQELCLISIEDFFKTGLFTTLLINESLITDSDSDNKNVMTENLMTALNSLPNKVANSTLGKFSEIFHHELFFQILSFNTCEAMEILVKRIRDNQAVSCKFLSQMIGSFSSGDKRDSFLGILFPFMIAKSSSDYIWRRLSKIIFSKINERRLESVVVQFAKSAPWFGCMKWTLEDAIIMNRKLKFLLTYKLLFVRCFVDVNILKNIIGYIAKSCHNVFVEVIQKLFSVWCDASSIKHTSYEQHKYITQAILICLSHMEGAPLKKHKFDITAWLAPGMGHHLNSTNTRIRILGMIVGECVSSKAALTDNRLAFEYEKNDETKDLLQLMQVDQCPTEDYYSELLNNHSQIEHNIKLKLTRISTQKSGTFERLTTSKSTFLKVISHAKSVSGTHETNDSGGESKDDLDSDDDEDLVPYDMSHYSEYKKVKAPSYVRDCIEGLLEQEDRDKFEAAIYAVTDLIKKNPTSAKECSLELCKILLVLDDKYATENFFVHRMSAMTELVIVNPEEVTGYLTHEFYEENYCLQHRIDILDVLTASSRILSSVVNSDNGEAIQKDLQQYAAPSGNWKDVVDRRIEAKTRRFAKTKRKSFSPKANQFGLIAGCFFYPLLAGYDRRVRTMDLLGNDAMVLGRMLYSLGTIVYSATNTMASQRMAKSLLDFIFEIRFHTESYVRQGVLFCISIASLSISKDLISSDIIGELIQWVEQIASEDSNDKTREMAIQTAVAVKTNLSKGLSDA